MRRTLIPILLTVFLDLIGFGIVIPLLTYYAEGYGANPVEVTWLMACYSLAQFLMAPAWGSLSDRIGRRPVLLISVAVTALALAGFAAANTLTLLFLFRTLHGLGAANVSTAQAAIADVTPPEKRAMGMGLIGAAFGVGFTVGPFVGGELSRYGYAAPIWVAAGLSTVNFFLAYFMLPETRKPDTQRLPRPRDPRAFLQVIQHPVVGLLVALTFVLTSAFTLMESSFTLFAEHVRNLDAMHVGRMFGIAGLTMVIVQGGLIGRLARRFGEPTLVTTGIALLAVSLAVLPFAPPPVAMVTVFVFMAIGQGISGPSLQALVSKGTSAAEQGFILGANQSMSALARAVGPAMSGLLYARIAPQAPFFVSSGILVFGVVGSVAAVRRWKRGMAAPFGDDEPAPAGGG